MPVSGANAAEPAASSNCGSAELGADIPSAEPSLGTRGNHGTGVVPSSDFYTPDNVFKGIRARVGIWSGPMDRVLPHGKSGRADYLGPPANRAARTMGAAQGGQVSGTACGASCSMHGLYSLAQCVQCGVDPTASPCGYPQCQAETCRSHMPLADLQTSCVVACEGLPRSE